MSGKRMPWVEEVVLNVLRIASGFLFWQHGVQKLFGTLGREAPVEFFTQMGLAGVLETVGGSLLVLGLFTRPTAFLLSGVMAWAYFQVHAPQGLWPIMNRGELAALYSFLFLYLAVRGGGSFGVDGILRLRKREPREPPALGRELREEELAPDPEVAELLGDDPRS